MLTNSELEVLVELLRVVEARYIGPVELQNSTETMAIVNAARGTRDEKPEGISISTSVTEMATHFANRIEQEFGARDDAFKKAESIDELLPSLDADVEAMRNVWMAYGKNMDGSFNEHKAQNVIVGVYITLKKFGLIAERLARPAFGRNEWRTVEKSIEDTVDKWFKRQADGSPGLRRVH